MDEAPYVYGYLCDLVEANHPVILGANNANLPKVISIIAEAFVLDALPPDNEAKIRMVNLVKQIQTNQPLFEACLAPLNESQRQALSEAVAASQQQS